MSAYYIVYHALILLAWSLSLVLLARKHHRYLPLCILMGATLAVELVAEWLTHVHRQFSWIYHGFVVLEYGLLCWYFANVSPGPWRKFILCSIPLFAVASVLISFNLYEAKDLPGQNINIEGMLISAMCALVLFNLDSKKHAAITAHPDFWICVGLLVFFAGTFFSNGVFSYLMSLDRDQARRLFSMVNKPLNLVLYSCLTTGFICAMRICRKAGRAKNTRS